MSVLRQQSHLVGKAFPESVKIVEVSPRDGLQNEKNFVPTESKVELIDRLSMSGLKVVEATSFVSPKAIPQLADGSEVLAKIKLQPGVSYPVLVPNTKGMQGALKANVAEIAVFGAASEAFTQKNINCTIKESLDRFQAVMDQANENNIKVRGYVSCVMGCPYQGDIDPTLVDYVASKLFKMGCYEISLGDTIGIGYPSQTQELLEAVKLPVDHLAAHFHNTYDRAIPNLLVAFSKGVSVADSAVSGIGGCPYAKGASGNVATEDVLYLCELLGIEHGVDLKSVMETGNFISGVLDRENLSSVSAADLDQIPERREEIKKILAEI